MNGLPISSGAYRPNGNVEYLPGARSLVETAHVLGVDDDPRDRRRDPRRSSIDVQAMRLRKKIPSAHAEPPFIRTERGAGYGFTAEVETIREGT